MPDDETSPATSEAGSSSFASGDTTESEDLPSPSRHHPPLPSVIHNFPLEIHPLVQSEGVSLSLPQSHSPSSRSLAPPQTLTSRPSVVSDLQAHVLMKTAQSALYFLGINEGFDSFTNYNLPDSNRDLQSTLRKATYVDWSAPTSTMVRHPKTYFEWKKEYSGVIEEEVEEKETVEEMPVGRLLRARPPPQTPTPKAAKVKVKFKVKVEKPTPTPAKLASTRKPVPPSERSLRRRR